MAKMKTSELNVHALNKLSAIAFNPGPEWGEWSPATNWEQGKVLIEREGIETWYRVGVHFIAKKDDIECWGRTRLLAALRCYVASKLGDEVELRPEELQ